MSIQDIEFLRDQILILIEAIGPTGHKPDTLKLQLKGNGFHHITDQELTRNLVYLHGKGLITPRQSVLSKGTVRYAITAHGTDYLESKGLI